MPSHSTAPPSTQVPSTREGVPLNFPPDPPLPADDTLAASPGVHELPAVPRTLLIPLAARAMGAGCFPHLACGDALATRLLQTLGVDVSAYLEDRPTVLNILWRTRHICRAARSFFVHHPHAWGINLGAGLSHYFQWLDNSHNTWVDADLPEVMALRRSLIDEHSPRLRQAILDICNPHWWQALHLPRQALEQPLFMLCEGVLMYLQPAQVQAVLAEFAQCAPPGSRMVLDVLTRQAVGHAATHPSVGRTGAEFCWGVGRIAELEQVHPRLTLLREQSVAECYGWTGIALDMLWRPWLGAPLYGMATLGVDAGR